MILGLRSSRNLVMENELHRREIAAPDFTEFDEITIGENRLTMEGRTIAHFEAGICPILDRDPDGQRILRMSAADLL